MMHCRVFPQKTRSFYPQHNFFLLFLLTALLPAGVLNAQRRVTGKVTDGHNQPYCVTVFAEKSGFAQVRERCSLDGSYSLYVPPGHPSLYFLGETVVEVPLGNSDTLNILYPAPFDRAQPLAGEGNKTPRTQEIRVSGQVVNGNNEPLRASVAVGSPGVRVETDASGRFALLVPPGQEILTITCKGYETREVLLADEPAVYIPVTMIRENPGRKKLK